MMTRTMKRAVLTVLLGVWAAVDAQAPPGELPAVGDAPPEESVDATAAPEEALDTAAMAEEPAADEPVEEMDASEEPLADGLPADAPGEFVAGPEAAVEENPAVQASAGEEFTPDDEISEDYPVPLPSDI